MSDTSGHRSGRPQGSGQYVTLRGQTYYFHYNIPAALRSAFDGKRHIRRSLGTGDKSTALKAARPMVEAIEARIDAVRAEHSPEAVMYRLISETDDAAHEASKEVIWEDEKYGIERKVAAEKVEIHGPQLAIALKRREVVKRDFHSKVRRLVNEMYWITEPYWTIAKDDDWYNNLLSHFDTELNNVGDTIKSRFSGENLFTLDWAFNLWNGQETRPAQTVKEVKKHLEEFKGFSKTLLIEEVKRRHLTEWRSVLQQTVLRDNTTMAPKTVNQRLQNILVLLRVGWREMEVPGFDTARLLGGGEIKKPRREWSDEEIIRVMTGVEPGSDLALLLALGLVYGPRIGEFMSVRKDDLSIRPDLMWIELRGEYTKTGVARSIVLVDALRPAFERLAATRKSGQFLLDIPRPKNPNLKIGHEASRIFGRLTKRLGIDRNYHELRHTVKTFSRRTPDVQQVDIDRITGHAPANIGAIYGAGTYHDLKNTAEKIHAASFTPEMHAAFAKMLVKPE